MFVLFTVAGNCTDGHVELRFGSYREGTVEVCINGVLGTVCDILWDDQDAAVVCKQLGFSAEGITLDSFYCDKLRLIFAILHRSHCSS